MSAKLAVAEAELAQRTGAFAAAGNLSPVEESPADEDDTAVEPGTPELSDREDSDDDDNNPSSKSNSEHGAAATDREAAANDPIMGAALAEIDAHNLQMFNLTHGVQSQAAEEEANRGLSAPEILVCSALAGAQLGEQSSQPGWRTSQLLMNGVFPTLPRILLGKVASRQHCMRSHRSLTQSNAP